LAASVIFGLMYKIGDHAKNALWYMAYIIFLTAMTYVGGVGAMKWFNIDIGSAIVVIVSLALFLPWGVASRMSKDELGIEPKVAEQS
jgi:glucose dehydrogenase